MKNTFSILALAATAAATGFKDAPPFSCPGNTDNHCTDDLTSGFDFSGVPAGPFSVYKSFNWKGFTCGGNSKRFQPRTGGQQISGSCGYTKETSPSFGCDASVGQFSLSSIGVKPEFDCDLEFHYDMPGGSTCKHRTACSSSGTTVNNDQCGGATNVTIVYPSGQPNKPPKSTCSVGIHTISFDCSSSSTKPPVTTTKPGSAKATSTSVATTTSETKGVETTTSASTTAVQTTSTTSVVETTTTPVTTAPPVTTQPTVTTQPPFINETTSNTEETSSESTTETTSLETSTVVTTFQSTSTVFTTSTATITSCAATVTNCPAHSVTTVVVTVAVSTTICPVTETRTTIHTHTKPIIKGSSVAATTSVAGTTSQVSQISSSSLAAGTTSQVSQVTSNTQAVGTTTTTSSLTSVETLPCPSVVPQCLNTFLFSVGCSDNSDSSCYCPDEVFVTNIFNCIYAHGESAEVVTQAVIFFQGICAPYVPSNPAIATAATVTSFVTASGTATTSLAPVYTTVTVVSTTVVPCTDSAGSTIPSSSSTVVISTAITVPNVAFTTGTGTGSSVGLVPATATSAAAITAAATTAAATLITAPAGTGSFTPKPTTSSFVTISGSGRVSTGFGLALAVMAFVAVL